MSINLGGTSAWSPTPRLEAGTYLFKPVPDSLEKKPSSGGYPQIEVNWRVADGSFAGAEQRDWVTFTDASMGRVVQLIEACGEQVPQEDFASLEAVRDWVFEHVLAKGPLVEGVVRIKPSKRDPSKEFPEIVGYRQPTDIPGGASGVTGGPRVNPNGSGSGDKEALPF